MQVQCIVLYWLKHAEKLKYYIQTRIYRAIIHTDYNFYALPFAYTLTLGWHHMSIECNNNLFIEKAENCKMLQSTEQ